MTNKELKIASEKYLGAEISDALSEKIQETVDALIESDEVESCPECQRLFLTSEFALQYEQSNGDFTCDCCSPENKAADFADFQNDLDRED